MKDLMNYLEQHNRTFPTGLSKLPGAGYILTGGVSPMSRRYGLAIDNLSLIHISEPTRLGRSRMPSSA